jgi:hypothetical protein
VIVSNSWATKEVLELDLSAAVAYVEVADREPKLGGRWLVFAETGEVWWELPDGTGYRRSVYSAQALPGRDFTPVSP